MRNHFLFLWLFFLLIPPSSFALQPTVLINRIEGVVYDAERRPLEGVYVELRNEVDSPIAQTKTNASGRFTFSGMPNGRYIVKVLPLRTNFAEQTQEVYVSSVRPNNSDVAYVDFYLTANKRAEINQKSPAAIFVQEIPPAAKKLYEDGVGDLKKNQDAGFAKIEEALKIFPQYFEALSLLGKEYVLRKDYEKAYPYLVRAIEVNPRSFSNYFRLGYAFYQLKEYPAALKAAEAAVTLVPESVDAQLLYGTILRINGNSADAEKALTKANALAKEKNSEVHWQLALLYNRLKRNQDAVRELETFLKLKPDSPEKAKIRELIEKLKTSANK